MAEITWCSRSLRDLERQLAARGFRCGKDAVARMMRAEGCSLQGMSRTIEGRRHPDRDARFGHVNAMIAEYRAAGDPVISVDGKKKEQPGPFRRDGRSWRPKGDPVAVRDHDFPDEELGKITPYGSCGIAAGRGFVSAGTSCGTAAFAVNALRLWWQREGAACYPGARRLLVTCDAGGSDGYRCRLRKDQPAALGAGSGLAITVCHFPPGTSKRNKIGPRLFCHITRTWRGRPLMTVNDAVAGIAGDRHRPGPEVHRRPGRRGLPRRGQDQRSADGLPQRPHPGPARHPRRAELRGPARPPPGPGTRTRPAARTRPRPGRPRRPGRHPRLARPAGRRHRPVRRRPRAAAAREQRLHLDRGHARRKAGGGGRKRLPFEAIVTAAACHLRLRMPCRLLEEILGVHESTISIAARRVTPLLAGHGITRQDGGTRITTLAQLREHAAAAGIALTLPDPAGHEHPASATRPKLIADASPAGKKSSRS
jgi:hypothetical protein